MRNKVLLWFLIGFSMLICGNLCAQSENIKWYSDLSNVEMPDTPAAGMIHGAKFTPDKAILKGDVLTIREGKDFLADREIMIFLFSKNGIEGETYNISLKDRLDIPHVHMKWKPEGRMVSKNKAYPNGYSMRLEFGKKVSNKVPAKIYLCLPDDLKSFLAGSFEVELK